MYVLKHQLNAIGVDSQGNNGLFGAEMFYHHSYLGSEEITNLP